MLDFYFQMYYSMGEKDSSVMCEGDPSLSSGL